MSVGKLVKGLGAAYYNAAFTMPNIGVLKAALSPQNQNLLKILDPKRDDGSISFEKKNGSGCVPKVNFQHLDTSGTYEVRSSPGCTAPAMTNPFATKEFYVEQYRESGFSIDECGFNLLESEMEAYNKAQILDGRSVGSIGYGGRWKDTINANLVKSVKGIISAVNTLATTNLVSKVGINPIYGTDTAQPIRFYTTSEEQGITRHFMNEMDKLRRRRNITGRLIIVTGSDDLASWFKDVCNLGCCSEAGLDYSKVDASNFEVYFDYALNAELGESGFLVIEPETFTMVNVDKWRNLKTGIGKEVIDNVRMGVFAIQEPSIRYLDKSCVAEVANPRLIFDLRIIEKACVSDSFTPSVHFIPGLQFDFWNRPEDSAGVTGVYRYKVGSFAPTPAPTYTMTFDSDGGSAVSPITSIVYGAKITAPTPPTKALYTFKGWFKNQSLTQEWVFGTDQVSGSSTLYAKWELT